MIQHLIEPSNITTTLEQREDYYLCPECLTHFAAAPEFCWFCGAKFRNHSTFTKVFPRDKEDE